MPKVSTENQVDVLIVGAGPSGLMMACQLACRGISFRIIDKKVHPANYSGALILQARSMEMFQHLGIAQKAIHDGIIASEIKLIFKGKKSFAIPVKNIGQGLSPFPWLLMLEQSKTEQLLTGFIQSQGRCVEREIEMVTFAQDDDRVIAQLKHPSGEIETVQSKYLIGADGAHSLVRKQLQIPFVGKTYPISLFVTDCKSDLALSPGELCFSFSEAATTGFFPLPGGRWRIDGTLTGAPGAIEGAEFNGIGSGFADRTRINVKISDPEWFSVFQSNDRYATTFQKNRCFLVGDAAHIHSPVGAQGMNTGLQDSCNLAWKLACVLRGELKPGLLESYSAERMVIAKSVIRETHRAFSLVTSRNFLAGRFRLEILPVLLGWGLSRISSNQFIRHSFFRRISGIGIHYRKSSWSKHASSGNFPARAPKPGDRLPFLLFREGDQVVNIQDKVTGTDFCLLIFSKQSIPEAIVRIAEKYSAVISLVTIPFTPETASLHHLFGIKEYGCYLIRPDQYIAYRSIRSDAEHFGKYLRQFAELIH